MEIRGRAPFRRLTPALLLALLGLGMAACMNGTPAPPPSTTGYEVLPRFENFYADAGGQTVLGEPITTACAAPDGRTVQYFQRARLDSLPEEEEEVVVYPLGAWALSGIESPVPALVPADSETRSFSETDYTVQDEFLAFYEANEGALILGPPISSQLDEGELRVQYFENGRLEWHPSAPRSLRVRLGPLGQAHYLQEGNKRLRCDVLARPAESGETSPLDVTAAVKEPILYTGEEQVIFVKTTGPAGQPVAGVPISLTVIYRGESISLPLGSTDEQGAVTGPVPLPAFEPGEEVEVQILVYGPGTEIRGQSALSFKTWW